VNAERLHAIARAIQADLDATEAVATLNSLQAELAATVSDPSTPSHQAQVGAYRTQLSERLAASQTNQFSDAWMVTLEELGVADILGNALRERIEEIFLRNEITPTLASEELAEIANRLSRLAESVGHLIAGMEVLGVGSEELELGEFEIGFLIPREAVGNELEALGKEFVELDKLLVPFAELCGVNRPDFEVKSISSSNFGLFLSAFPDLAVKLSRVIESLLASWEKIGAMRKTTEELEQQNVPPEVFQPLIEHANAQMNLDIDELTRNLIEEARPMLGDERANELTVEVKHSLRAFADRIDEAYSISVRSFTPPADEETEESEVWPETIQAARQIAARQPRMRRMNLTGRPILTLSKGAEDEAVDGEVAEPNEGSDPPEPDAAL
jgi:hypothetical protein